MATPERCQKCRRETPTRRFIIGSGYRSRGVWLCADCAAPVVELLNTTTQRRDATLSRVEDRTITVEELEKLKKQERPLTGDKEPQTDNHTPEG